MPDNHEDEVVIKVRDGGPYKVTGPVRLTDAAGAPLATPDGPLALCRCGRSRTKPYCDRSHRTLPGSTLAVHAGLPAPAQGEPYLPGPGVRRALPLPRRRGGPRAALRPLREPDVGALGGGARRARGRGGDRVRLRDGRDQRGPADDARARRRARRAVRRLLHGAHARRTSTWAARGRGPPRADRRRRGARRARRGDARLARVAEQPAARRRRRRRARGAGARGRRARRGRQHARDAAAPAPARARRRLLGRQRGQAADRPQRPAAGPRRGRATTARAASLRAWRTTTGAIPGPFETWLAHRSLATLGLRVERQERTAAALHAMLAARADVAGRALAGRRLRRLVRPRRRRARARRSSAPAGWSPRRRASAACTRAPSAARAGAATPSRPG